MSSTPVPLQWSPSKHPKEYLEAVGFSVGNKKRIPRTMDPARRDAIVTARKAWNRVAARKKRAAVKASVASSQATSAITINALAVALINLKAGTDKVQATNTVLSQEVCGLKTKNVALEDRVRLLLKLIEKLNGSLMGLAARVNQLEAQAPAPGDVQMMQFLAAPVPRLPSDPDAMLNDFVGVL